MLNQKLMTMTTLEKKSISKIKAKLIKLCILKIQK